MLSRVSEMDETEIPIVSLCIVSDKSRVPEYYSALTRTHDDQTDADLWKDTSFFGFSRTLRYLAISRKVHDPATLEVVTDLLVIGEKDALPANFISIDYTADTKERALRKKYLCARFTPRNAAIDAVVDVVVLSRSKRVPHGYTSAGEIDNIVIAFKVAVIPETYGRLTHSQSAATALYPSAAISASVMPPSHSMSNVGQDGSLGVAASTAEAFTLRAQPYASIKGIDGVTFKLKPSLAAMATVQSGQSFSDALPPLQNGDIDSWFTYNLATEKSCV